MPRTIVRNEDFTSALAPTQVQYMYYSNQGFPWANVSCSQAGAIYLDSGSGQLWVCVTPNSTATNSWKPFNGQITNNIRISEEVQDGDIIGLFGPGIWTASSNLQFSRTPLCGGSQNAGIAFGGNLTTELFNGAIWISSANILLTATGPGGCGAQNAAILAGGATSSPSLATLNQCQVFNGILWSNSGNMVLSKLSPSLAGTNNATVAAAGSLTVSGGFAITITEIFNGAVWASSVNLNQSRGISGAAISGALNAALIASGGPGGGSILSASEIFNGSAWVLAGPVNIPRFTATSAGSLYSTILVGGQLVSSVYTNTTEIFNGSAWYSSSNVTLSLSSTGTGGNPLAGFAAGGTDIASTTYAATNVLNQSIYRKVNYSHMPSVSNIGMAYNVTQTSLTASLITGDLPSINIPTRKWFGISRFNNDQTNVYVASTTGTISSITASNGSATLNLSSIPWDGVAPGNYILINPSLTFNAGSLFPITGGTNGSPVVRWENASSSASTSLTFAVCWGQRLTNLTAQSITVSAGVMNINLTYVGGVNVNNTNYGNISYTSFARWIKINDVLYIPYSTVSGTNGSSANYGSYLITSIATTSQTAVYTVSVTSVNAIANTENPSVGIGGIKIFQQAVINPVALSNDDVVLGFSNKMHSPNRPFFDDFDNGLF